MQDPTPVQPAAAASPFQQRDPLTETENEDIVPTAKSVFLKLKNLHDKTGIYRIG